MIEKTKELIITNRSASTVYYTVPNLRVNRTLAAGQSIRVTYDELEQLSLKQVLVDKTLKIPAYQRIYCWKEKTVIQLLNDLININF